MLGFSRTLLQKQNQATENALQKCITGKWSKQGNTQQWQMILTSETILPNYTSSVHISCAIPLIMFASAVVNIWATKQIFSAKPVGQILKNTLGSLKW